MFLWKLFCDYWLKSDDTVDHYLIIYLGFWVELKKTFVNNREEVKLKMTFMTPHLPVRCSSGPPWPPFSSSSSPSTNPLGKRLLFFLFSCLTVNQQQLSSFILSSNSAPARLRLTCDGTFFGGSIRMEGSHSPGGRTVTWSRNSSIPAIKSLRSLAL